MAIGIDQIIGRIEAHGVEAAGDHGLPVAVRTVDVDAAARLHQVVGQVGETDIALQPGRPGPHGVDQCGSSVFAPFHSAKSRGSRLMAASESVAASMSSGFCPDSDPYALNERMSIGP